MKKRHTEEQIAHALRQAESGLPVGEICRKLGISEPTFYRWKKKNGDLGLSELRELRQVRQENRQLKSIVADLTLDKQILQESLRKNSEAGAEVGARRVGLRRLPDQRASRVRVYGFARLASGTAASALPRLPSGPACTSLRGSVCSMDTVGYTF